MASRAVPVPGPMADPGTPVAMADPGTLAAMADQAAVVDPGTPAAMADLGSRVLGMPPWRVAPPPNIFLG